MQMYMFGANLQTKLRDPTLLGSCQKDWRNEGGLQPHRKNNIYWPDHPELPEIRSPTKSVQDIMYGFRYVAEREGRPSVLRRFDAPA